MSDRGDPARSPAVGRVELRLGADGLEVHKRRRGADGAEALAAEAAWLRAGRGPGVVALVGVTQDDEVGGDVSRLVTRSAGPSHLGEGALEPRPAAAALAEVADTLARLHDLGLVHGAVEPDHIVLDADDGPRLISPDAAGGPDPAVDLAGLGRCVEHLLWRWDDLAVAVPRRGDWERASLRLIEGEVASSRRAGRLLAGLGAPDPHRARRPPARIVAGALAVTGLATLVAVSTSRPPADLGAAGAGPVLRLDPACEGPAAVTLGEDAVVWAFDHALDGARGRVVGEAPGAVRLAVEACTIVALDADGGQVALVRASTGTDR